MAINNYAYNAKLNEIELEKCHCYKSNYNRFFPHCTVDLLLLSIMTAVLHKAEKVSTNVQENLQSDNTE